MSHYIEFRILPDPEFPSSIVMNLLYNKLHKALVQTGSTDIGVSFPDFDNKRNRLGERLRLHGTDVHLKNLIANLTLSALLDYLRVGDVQEIPKRVSYVTVKRVQCKSSAERLRRRIIKRCQLSDEDALNRIPDSVQKQSTLPYVTLKSDSTGQFFRLFIDQQIAENPVIGTFNAYALSNGATVPKF
jgi:CRISPR-associated endonuclease Csy4